jgi:DNA helicase-2/ATP-dependent DNA helicase PcrA
MAYTPTQEQTKIANHTQGHAKISAVAGSGKTATMVELVCQSVINGIPPQRIAILMFNREAADDFRRRMIGAFTHVGKTAPEVRTFHSAGLKLCKKFEELGYLERKHITDKPWQKQDLAKQALEQATGQLRFREDIEPKDLTEDFMRFVEQVKGDIEEPEIVIGRTEITQQWHQVFLEAFREYERRRLKQHLRFYEDMIWEPVQCMMQESRSRAIVENRMDLVICDESQDLNRAQNKLVQYIAGTRARVVAVGDVDQTIYAWRGAYPRFLLEEFEQHHTPTTKYHLSNTFRYGHRLSLMANHLIRHNREREDTFCVSHAVCPDTQVTLTYDQSVNGKTAVQHIADQWIEDGNEWENLAILIRDNASATGLMLDFLTRDTPFCLKGNVRFLGSEPYIDALLGVAEHLSNTLWRQDNLTRIVNLLRFPYVAINQEQWRQIAMACLGKRSLLAAMESPMVQKLHDQSRYQLERRLLWLENSARTRQTQLDAQYPDQPGKALRQLLEEYVSPAVARYTDAFGWMATTHTAYDAYEQVLREYLRFIERINLPAGDLVSHLDRHAKKVKSQSNGIAISTCHGAKGLEYDGVILCGLEQGRFPNKRAPIEEERRLFYVAITRAKKHLYLVAPPDPELEKAQKTCRINMPAKQGIASQFLYEMAIAASDRIAGSLLNPAAIEQFEAVEDASVINRYLEAITPPGQKPSRQKECKSKQTAATGKTAIGAEEDDLPTRIRHNVYGEGVVMKWRGEIYMYIKFATHEGWFREPDTHYERLV